MTKLWKEQRLSDEFVSHFEGFFQGCKQIVKKFYEGPNHPPERDPVLSYDLGQRYIRVVKTSHGQRGVYCFVDTTNGDVLKAASWKVPAKHARGNIFDESNGLKSMNWHGAAYLR